MSRTLQDSPLMPARDSAQVEFAHADGVTGPCGTSAPDCGRARDADEPRTRAVRAVRLPKEVSHD